jgi:CubicO group peptidase (beta-lactamase class C family)
MGLEVQELSAFDTTMKDFMTSRDISAGALAITYHSRLVFARGYTWSDVNAPATHPTSLFRIASLSKPITATGILKLVEDKKLKLDDNILNVLPFGPPEGKQIDPLLWEAVKSVSTWPEHDLFDKMLKP